MELKHLNAQGKGELDYDYLNDILFFKIKEREYKKSIELEDITLDIDTEGFITGIQLFAASKIFNLEKELLRNIKNWEFNIKVERKVIFVNLTFETIKRNKIIERGQNLIRESSSFLTDSEVSCKMEV
mgnify:CR=1 FL=1